MAKLTQWIAGRVLPARPGVYNVSCRSKGQTGNWYGRFDGVRWYGSWGDSPDDSVMYPGEDDWGVKNDGTPTTWRGLARAPK